MFNLEMVVHVGASIPDRNLLPGARTLQDGCGHCQGPDPILSGCKRISISVHGCIEIADLMAIKVLVWLKLKFFSLVFFLKINATLGLLRHHIFTDQRRFGAEDFKAGSRVPYRECIMKLRENSAAKSDYPHHRVLESSLCQPLPCG
jgi:hypothetical protein